MYTPSQISKNHGCAIRERQLSGLIGKIYDASLEPMTWQSVIEEIINTLSGSAGHFFTPMHMPNAGGFSFSANIPETFMEQYNAKYHKDDLWTQGCIARNLNTSGTVVVDEDLVPRRNLVRSRFYRELLKPSDTARACMSIVFGVDSGDMPFTSMSIYRSVRSRPFPLRAKQWMRLLNPHISRSLGITHRLQDAQFTIATTLAALDRIQFGVLLLDARGSVTFANRCAAKLLDEEPALRLRRGLDGRDRLVGATAGMTADINRFIASALTLDAIEVDHFVKSMPIPRAGGAAPLLLSASALPLENRFSRGGVRSGAILFILNAAEPLVIDRPLMVRLFRLTDAEIALVSAMCAGQSLAEAAGVRGVSVETVRSQLKSVFAKTQTSRQAELIRLVLGLSSTR